MHIPVATKDGTEQWEAAWPHSFSPEMWHNFSNRKHNQNNQIAVFVPDIDELVGFILIFPSFPCLHQQIQSCPFTILPAPVGVWKCGMVAVPGQKGRKEVGAAMTGEEEVVQGS